MNSKQAAVTVFAITGIVALEICALMNGINGPFLITGIVAIAGLGGYQIRQARSK